MINDSTFLWVLIRADGRLNGLVVDMRLVASIISTYVVLKVLFDRTGRPHELLLPFYFL